MSENIWCHCGSCKKPILQNTKYFACAISSCKKAHYCSMPCFDAHVPVFRHKDAWAEERIAPKSVQASPAPSRIDTARISSNNTSTDTETLPRDILIVASKLKDYIRIKSGMNTSANVLERLSDMVRIHCDKAIAQAKEDNRKTVMDRDFIIYS